MKEKGKYFLGVLALCVLLAAGGCAQKQEETIADETVTQAVNTPTDAPDLTDEPQSTPSSSPDLTDEPPSEAPTLTPTQTPTPSETPTPTPTFTPTPTPTPTKKPSVPTPTPSPTPKPSTPSSTPKPSAAPSTSVTLGTSLYKRYQGYFDFGCCVNELYLSDANALQLILEQFNSITCENEMKPEAFLNQDQCRTQGKVVISVSSKTKSVLDWAKKNGLKVRGHVLVWYSQTPDWFFREGFSKDGAYVSREEMLTRMESYIKQVLNYCDTNYPGMFYAWDVVNEAFTDDGTGYRDCPWYQILGEDYVIEAFRYARKYAASGTKLFYNDFNTYINYSDKIKTTRICNLVKELQKENLIDGVGMQAHLGVYYPSADDFVRTVTTFSNLGVEVHITELDVTTPEEATMANDVAWKLQAEYLDRIFSALEKNDRTGVCNLTSVTVWGISDKYSWRANRTPLLFDKNLMPKDAYYSVLQQ